MIQRNSRLIFLVLLLIAGLGASIARAQGGPPFITDDPGTPGNHHWEINFGWIANHNPGQSYYEIPDVDLNYGWGDRIQLKYELPMAVATDPDNTCLLYTSSNPSTSTATLRSKCSATIIEQRKTIRSQTRIALRWQYRRFQGRD